MNSFRIFICVLWLGCLVSSCSEQDAESVGVEQEEKENQNQEDSHTQTEISIAYLKSMWEGHPKVITEDCIIRGRVVSTDLFGNFYHSIFVQDDTAGIEVLLNGNNLYETFLFKGYVEIRLLKLTLGAYGGFVQLGYSGSGTDYQVTAIPESEIYRLVKSYTPAEITDFDYDSYTVSELTDRQLGKFICVAGVEIIEEQMGLALCDEGEVTERTLRDVSGNTIGLRTFPWALFAYDKLPLGSGNVYGILTSFNGQYRMRINNYYDLVLDNDRF